MPQHPPSPAMIRRAVVASTIGNGLEWFDFLIYGFFAGIISQVFFPSGNPVLSLVLTWSTFAVGFVVRPFGGILLGMYADRAGRQKALTLLILLMALGTVLLGVAPGYAAIGLAAPLLVVASRIFQGLSVGGEFASATAMLVEYAPPGRKMFYGSFQMCSQSLAVALAAGFAYGLIAALSPAALHGLGLAHSLPARRPGRADRLLHPPPGGGIAGVLAPRRAPAAAGARRPRRGARPACRGRLLRHRHHRLRHRERLSVEHLSAGLRDPDPASAALGAAAGRGHLRDDQHLSHPRRRPAGRPRRRLARVPARRRAVRHRRRAAVRLHAGGAELAASVGSAARRQRAAGFMAGPIPGLLAGMFPTAVRSTGMAVSYNVSVAVFGGMAPLTVTWLTGLTGSRMVPAYYLAAAAALSLVMVLSFRRARASCPAPAQ